MKKVFRSGNVELRKDKACQYIWILSDKYDDRIALQESSLSDVSRVCAMFLEEEKKGIAPETEKIKQKPCPCGEYTCAEHRWKVGYPEEVYYLR